MRRRKGVGSEREVKERRKGRDEKVVVDEGQRWWMEVDV